ncbi:anti-sigma factor [Streptomyces sp. NPDC005438]|uniref:anti-sigma factor n=1 Tax=Streptomyces sp. NPDC005438 TaxID=3156880 RepID=UPI00339F33B9
MRGDAELHTLTGAYAVHALPEPEREEFERHLADCAACAREVAELTATAERLGLAVAVTPPEGMRERVLRGISAVRQEPPHTTRERTSRTVPPRSTRAWRVSRLVLAACVAGAVGLGGVAVWQYDRAREAEQRSQRAEQRSERMARVLSADDARVSPSHRLPGGARATVVVSRKQDRAVFLASGMGAPPRGKVYQLWFEDGGAMRPAGLMPGDTDSGAVLMEGPVGGASGMGITVEPTGGSQRPTSDPVARMELPKA